LGIGVKSWYASFDTREAYYQDKVSAAQEALAKVQSQADIQIADTQRRYEDLLDSTLDRPRVQVGAVEQQCYSDAAPSNELSFEEAMANDDTAVAWLEAAVASLDASSSSSSSH
jgi:hypothetical protein